MVALTAACTGQILGPNPVGEERELIRAVALDKTVACVGDDVEARVALIAPDPNASITIDGELGNPGIITLTRAGTHTIQVIARSGNAIDFESPQVVVNDCAGSPLMVRHWSTSDSPDVVQLEVTGSDGALYHWDFGDGTSRDTYDRVVAKSYALRTQDGGASTFMVSVTATKPGLSVHTRRHSVTLENFQFVRAGARAVELAAEYGRAARRVGPANQGATALTSLRLRNPSPDAVHLSSARVSAVGCDGALRGEVTVPLATVFASPPSTLSPGLVWSGELALPLAQVGDACRADITLLGDDTQGRTARTVVILELGVPDTSQVVTDPALLEKIDRARRILGKRDISHDELSLLERAGRL